MRGLTIDSSKTKSYPVNRRRVSSYPRSIVYEFLSVGLMTWLVLVLHLCIVNPVLPSILSYYTRTRLFEHYFLSSFVFLFRFFVLSSHHCPPNNRLPSLHSPPSIVLIFFSLFSFQIVSRSSFRTRACYSITRSAYDASCAASRSLRFMFSNLKPVCIDHPSRKI